MAQGFYTIASEPDYSEEPRIHRHRGRPGAYRRKVIGNDRLDQFRRRIRKGIECFINLFKIPLLLVFKCESELQVYEHPEIRTHRDGMLEARAKVSQKSRLQEKRIRYPQRILPLSAVTHCNFFIPLFPAKG